MPAAPVAGRDLTVQIRTPQRMICSVSVLRTVEGERSVVVAWVTGGKNELVRTSLENAAAHLITGIRDRLGSDPREINFQSPERRVLGIVAGVQSGSRDWAWWTKKDGVRLPGRTGVSLETAMKQCLDNIILLYQPS